MFNNAIGQLMAGKVQRYLFCTCHNNHLSNPRPAAAGEKDTQGRNDEEVERRGEKREGRGEMMRVSLSLSSFDTRRMI